MQLRLRGREEGQESRGNENEFDKSVLCIYKYTTVKSMYTYKTPI